MCVCVCVCMQALKLGCLKNEGGVHSSLVTEAVDKVAVSGSLSGGEIACSLSGLGRAKPLTSQSNLKSCGML